ncbi:putative immunity protein [Streptomyces sp. NPDC048584]|uniref:putative immunity protein n=1 Tax=Streptomyces sp. NPDC048584 TaxID=3365573 RepID=UPI00371FFE74
MASIQTLSDADRRVLARWAAGCAERVLPLFDADAGAVREIRDAVERTRRYSHGESSAADEIGKRMVAVKAAKAATTPAGAAAARSVAQAAAVAHMGAHALGAAAYATKAVSLAKREQQQPDAVAEEIRWQLGQLSDRERAALRLLPPLGADSSGPLCEGLLSRGILGATIREIQVDVGSTPTPGVA